ncbi:MAG: DUF6165 family protein [Alphaproteobacteria bacterium]
MLIKIDVSPGELLDKLTILEIKEERIKDPAKVQNVVREKEALERAAQAHIAQSSAIDNLRKDLKSVNERLWDVEDEIRECERAQDFGEKFIELARSVYLTNDHRSDIKRKINDLLGSRFSEVKSYSEYRMTER